MDKNIMHPQRRMLKTNINLGKILERKSRKGITMENKTLPLYPELSKTTINEDLRGNHRKFFGVTPGSLEVPGFEVKEVFMTHNNRNTIRGLHFQADKPQPKIIKLITGGPLLIHTLCCDPNLPEFGEVRRFELSATYDEDRLYIPGKWALGYRSFANQTKVLYIAGENFSPNGDAGIDPFDPALNIQWGITKEEALLSERDKDLDTFVEFAEKVKNNEIFSNGR